MSAARSDAARGESAKEFKERCDRLRNALIPDLVIDLFGTELKDPTPRLQELLDGRRHLIDVKTVVSGEGYRRAGASTAAHVNWKQAEVAKDYVQKAQQCDERCLTTTRPSRTR